jgi:hypothetical protein
MEISTTFTTTPKSVMQSYRACHRSRYVFRWVFTIGLAVLGLLQGDLVPILIGIAYFAFSEFSVRRQLKPYLSGPRTVTVTMTDDEYRTQGPHRGSASTWTIFTSVKRVGQFWILRISNMAALGLPTNALDEAQTAAFEELLRSKGLLRPSK